MAISVAPIEKPQIRVFGMAGTFHVGPDADQGTAVQIRYFNTVASGQDSPAAGNSRRLLEELKPMRERAQVSALRDLSSLLQRELDDARVAHQLVPYLQGVTSKIGFFPGILVALVPKGFLEAKDDAEYPAAGAAKDSPDEVVEQYGDCWTLRRFKSDGTTISLGRLEIDPAKSDLVVLDGQHRANAFRYVTGTFGAAIGETIYASFYETAGAIGAYTSELPVTILWFESNGTLDPKLLSRQLFVDVNMNAKTVSESRQILLDDRHNGSIVVGGLYRLLAKRGFDTTSFSLLHGGFDCEEDEQHPLSLFLPVQFCFAVGYFAFGDDRYDGLSTSLKSDSWRKQRNYNRAMRLMMGVTEALFQAAGRGDKDAVNQLSAELDKDFAPALLQLVEGFSLVDAHVKATAETEAWVKAGSTLQREAWSKVFCGGEGLYGAFKRTSPPSGRAKEYLKAIDEIEAHFLGVRAAHFEDVPSSVVRTAYQTFASKAGLAGFMMAAEFYCDNSEDGWDGRVSFTQTLAKLTKENWINVFGIYKPEVVSQLDPKLWPEIRNIVLRVIQHIDPEQEYYRTDELEDVNPDGKILWNILRAKYNLFKASLPSAERDSKRPDAQMIGQWRDDAIAHLKTTLLTCRLNSIVSDNALEIFCINRIDRLIPDDEQAEASTPSANIEDDDEEDD